MNKLERRVGLQVGQMISHMLVIAIGDCQIVSVVRQGETGHVYIVASRKAPKLKIVIDREALDSLP